jgi:hypothetical protein
MTWVASESSLVIVILPTAEMGLGEAPLGDESAREVVQRRGYGSILQ